MLRCSIGIDPGKKGAIGAVVFEYPSGKIIQVVSVKAKFENYHPSEFFKVSTFAFSDLLDKISHGVEVVIGVVEDQFLNKNVDTLKKITSNQAMWRLKSFLNFDIDFLLTSPGTWRSPFKIIKSKGNLKHQAVALVQERFNLKATQDEAEAIVMALYGVKQICP